MTVVKYGGQFAPFREKSPGTNGLTLPKNINLDLRFPLE